MELTFAAIAVALLFVIFGGAAIYRLPFFRVAGVNQHAIALLFCAKLIAGAALFWVYTYWYTDVQQNDIYKFFNDAAHLHSLLVHHPASFFTIFSHTPDAEAGNCLAQLRHWDRHHDILPINENRLMILIQMLLMFVSFKFYSVHMVIMAFVSLVASVFFLKAAHNSLFGANKLFLYAAMWMPSILFWCSGLLKETFVLLALGIISFGITALTGSFKRLLLLMAGFCLLAAVKVSAFIAFLPGIIGFFLFQKAENKSAGITFIRYSAIYILFGLLALVTGKLIPTLDIVGWVAIKQWNALQQGLYFNAGSMVHIPRVESWLDFMYAYPVGLVNALHRPFVWEAKNMMMLVSAIERTLFWLIIAVVMYRGRRAVNPNYTVICILLLGLLAYTGLAGVVTPVLGNLVRYVAPWFLPLVMVVLSVKQAGQLPSGSK